MVTGLDVNEKSPKTLPLDAVDTAESTYSGTDAEPDVTNADGWRRHPVDIRLSLPMLGKRMFLTLVGGIEKRGPERLKEDRVRYPLKTRSNIMFFVGLAVVLYLIGALLIVLIPFGG